MAKDKNNLVDSIRQSPPIDTGTAYDPKWVGGKTIIITGGSSGFGAGFSRHWALNGANVIVADINDTNGKGLVNELRKTSGNPNHHYMHCDVTNWQAQVDLFKSAVKLSPSGAIDAVVANAGIGDNGPPFHEPKGLDAEEPPKPIFKAVEVNLIGVMYTSYLAMFWLPRNKAAKFGSAPSASRYVADRHLLLIGSIASLAPIPHQAQYGTAKHGVLGLFRSLRTSAWTQGVRINMLCPYFMDTPILPAEARLLLAGGAMGKPEDVVDAGTRLVADNRIVGRALAIGPKVRLDDDWQLLPADSKEGKVTAIWECYADDFQETDAFTRRLVSVWNNVERVRGWGGYLTDIALAVWYPLGSWLGRKY